MKFDSVMNNLYLTWDIGLKTTEHAFRDKNVASLINKNDQFDIVILEQFFHDAWLPFATKFDAPLLTIATLGHADYFDNAMGLLTPSYVPHHVLTFTDQMTFYERCINLFWRLTDLFLRKYYYMEQMQKMADRYFGPSFNGKCALYHFFRICKICVVLKFIDRKSPIYIGIREKYLISCNKYTSKYDICETKNARFNLYCWNSH